MSRVLLVDDDAGQIEIRQLVLGRSGHSVSAAGNVAQARMCFAAAPPDIVVMDLRLPRAEDGLALIREWRSANPAVHIIVLSGYPADIEDKPEAALVDRILAKPVRSQVLVNVLAKLAAD